MAIEAPPIRKAMNEWIALGGKSSGILANLETHDSGYHLSVNQLASLGKRWSDYSVIKDPNGSDGPFVSNDYACAGDFYHGGDPNLRRRHLALLDRLRANDPSLHMICEMITQPWADQPVKYWARWRGVENLSNYTGKGHDKWSHISWYRSKANLDAQLWAGGGVTTVWCKLKDSNENVRYLQYRLKNLGFDPGTVDASYGDKTKAALLVACKAVYKDYAGNGSAYEADEAIYLDVLWAQKYGKDAPNLGPLFDRLTKLEAALKALPTQSLPGNLVLTITGGTLQVKPSA